MNGIVLIHSNLREKEKTQIREDGILTANNTKISNLSDLYSSLVRIGVYALGRLNINIFNKN